MIGRGLTAVAMLVAGTSVTTAQDLSTWYYKESADKLTDVPFYTVGRQSLGGPKTGIIVQCKEGDAVVFFYVGLTGIADSFKVDYRFDKMPARSVQAVGFGADKLIVTGVRAVELIQNMETHSSLYFRATLPISSSPDGEIDLNGFRKAIAPFRSKCW